MSSDAPCPSTELLRRSLDPNDPMTTAERQNVAAHVEHCTRGCKLAIDVLLRGNTVVVSQGAAGPAVAPGAAPCGLPAFLGRYRITAKLGAGSNGTVYRGYDDDLRREVAVKAPHRYRIATAADAAAYLAEARTVAGLDHPHIVPVFDLGRTDDGLCFVVSKYIEGGDLAHRLAEARPSFSQAAGLTAAVAEALHHAHTRGLVHRDVKPGNILIDPTGVPFLTDFGLALREEDFGRGAGLAGTPAYMSPEQAGGEGHRVDGRSDLFSLGVVLYELLTGRRPFRGDSVADVCEQILRVEARPPRQTDDAIPKEMERICLKALSKRAADRYTTARDMADDLRHFLAAETGTKSIEEANRSEFSQAGRPVRVVPKGLRSFDAHDADFFLELLPGPRDRDGLPDGVRFWKARIEEADPDETFAVGLLYGPSGCGKSSLVKAGLLPRLSGDVLAVYVEATAGETETRLVNGLRKHCPALSADLSLKELLAALRRGQGVPAGKKVVMVLDQFEQWLHAKKEVQNTELVQALRQCEGGRVQCVVMVRDDFWMAATRFLRELEVRLLEGQNSAAVDLFDRDHTCRVLAAFGRAFGKLPENAGDASAEQRQFMDQAASSLSHDGKVVCVRLALFADMMRGRPWTPAALKEVGGAEGVGATFLEETFSAAAAPPEHRRHQKAARAVLRELLPDAGTDIKGHMRSRADLLAASGYEGRPGDFADLVRILDAEIRLITPTDPEGNEAASGPSPAQGAERYYQLTHDYLVPSLRDWLTRKQKETRRGRAELLLADRSAIWNARPESRQLPSLLQWCGIWWLTRQKKWTAPQRLMMRKAAAYHGTRMLAAVFLLVLVGWGAYEGYGRFEAQALRDSLLNADPAAAPRIISDMAPYRRWTDPLLELAYEEAKAKRDARKQLLASLALAPTDPKQVAYLYDRLLDAEPQEVRLIVWGLSPHKGELSERLWAVVERPGDGREGRGLRAAAALAAYDAADERWDGAARPVTDQLVRVDPAFLAAWMEAFWPARQKLLDPLAVAFRDRQEAHAGEANLAASILAEYAAGQSDLLAELVMDADDQQFAVLFPKLTANQAGAVELLNAALKKSLDDEKTDPEKEKLAKRQANAAVALLRLGHADEVWSLFKHRPDPRARSYLIHYLSPRGADPETLMARLDEEKDASIRRALLLGLGEFSTNQLRPADREPLIAKLLLLYQYDPDAGLHGAADWLLRQWGQEGKLKDIDQQEAKNLRHRQEMGEEIRRELAKGQGSREGFWYVNGQEQTLVVVYAPADFLMGSPGLEYGREAQEDRDGTETQKVKRIDQPFAIAAREVTVEQFYRCPMENRGYNAKISPKSDCPMNDVTWYQAAEYCNWLTRQELPECQWKDQCYYLPNAGGKYAEGMSLAPDYLRRTGYRLPSEKEWEYACRAKAVTSRYYGETVELLDKYAWYTTNSEDRGMLPGDFDKVRAPGHCLKPNDLGLFDMLGNASEWCQDRFTVESTEESESKSIVNDRGLRVLRGGAFSDRGANVRTAVRDRSWPSGHSGVIGFRVAKTFR